MIIDTHSHLLLTVLAHGDVHRLMKDARDRVVASVLDEAIGTGDFLSRCRLIDAISKRHEVGIYMAAGLLPHYSRSREKADLEVALRQAQGDGRVRTIRERRFYKEGAEVNRIELVAHRSAKVLGT